MKGLTLHDAVATILAMGPDDGTAGSAVGTAVTVCFDKVSVSQSRETVDVSCGQDYIKHNRISKLDWKIDVETKLELGGTLLSTLQTDNAVVCTFAIVASGANVSGTGLVTDVSWSYDDPSTLSFSLIPYGTALTVTSGS